MNQIRKTYNEKIFKYFLVGLFCHIPIFLFQAWYFSTEYWVAAGLSTFFLVLPTLSFLHDRSHVRNGYLLAFSTMVFSGIMIHLGKGMIEMHFHIFVALAVLSITGYMGPVILAAATVAIHHVGFWVFLPSSIFNYEAGLGIVLLHATFVVVETVPAVMIAYRMGNFIDVQGSILKKLKTVSKVNLASAKGFKSTSDELSSGAQSQSKNVQDTVSAINEIESMTRMAQSTARESVKVVNEGTALSEASQRDMGALNQRMDLIEGSIENLNEVKEIVEQVHAKTGVINDIVVKTQLLSFNASIEAARAGVHGKGFGVVAEEVGKLAQLSGSAAKEIEVLLTRSNAQVEQIVKKINANVKDGIKASSTVNENFVKLKTQFDKIQANVKEILAANEENEKGISRVSSSLNQLGVVAETHVKEVDAINRFSNRIASSSHTLNDLVDEIRDRLDSGVESKIKDWSASIKAMGKKGSTQATSDDEFSDVA